MCVAHTCTPLLAILTTPLLQPHQSLCLYLDVCCICICICLHSLEKAPA